MARLDLRDLIVILVMIGVVRCAGNVTAAPPVGAVAAPPVAAPVAPPVAAAVAPPVAAAAAAVSQTSAAKVGVMQDLVYLAQVVPNAISTACKKTGDIIDDFFGTMGR